SALLARILVGCHLVEPLSRAAEAGIDLDECLPWCRPVPVDDIGRGVIGPANVELLHRLTALLNAHPPLFDHPQLSTLVTEPVRARARFEAPAGDGQILALHGG